MDKLQEKDLGKEGLGVRDNQVVVALSTENGKRCAVVGWLQRRAEG